MPSRYYYDTSAGGYKTTKYGTKGTGVWRDRRTGKIIQLGNRIRNSNGDYIQLNSDGSVTKLYDAKTTKFTRGKDNRTLASQMDIDNIKSNHIQQNGSWRRNTTNSLNKDTGLRNNKNIYKSTVDNKWHFFNSSSPVRFVNNKAGTQQQYNKLIPQQSSQVQQDIPWYERMKNTAFTNGNQLWDNLKDAGSTLVHGNAFSGKDWMHLIGGVARAGTNVLGATLGALSSGIINPNSEVAQVMQGIGSVFDVGKDAEFLRSVGGRIIGEDPDFYAPWDPRNTGFSNSRHWSWLGGEQERKDLNDSANFALSIFGLKGLGSSAKAALSVPSTINTMKTGFKTATGVVGKTKAVVNPFIENQGFSMIPGVSQVQSGVRAVNNVKDIFAPNMTIGQRLGNAIAAPLNAVTASDPYAYLYGANPSGAFTVSQSLNNNQQ